jgi:hypothetical protein
MADISHLIFPLGINRADRRFGNIPLTVARPGSPDGGMTVHISTGDIRRYWPNLQIPLLGLAIGATLVLGVRAISPHPGQGCGELGQIREEWEIGVPPQTLMCVATLDGDLVYGRVIATPKKKVTR